MKPRYHKYGAQGGYYKGIYFPSKREMGRYKELEIMEKVGMIKELAVHPRYGIRIHEREVCKVELDFVYCDKIGRRIYEDVKGFYTRESRLKHKLFEAYYGAKVTIVK